MVCKKCGNTVDDYDIYCAKCGEKIVIEEIIHDLDVRRMQHEQAVMPAAPVALVAPVASVAVETEKPVEPEAQNPVEPAEQNPVEAVLSCETNFSEMTEDMTQETTQNTESVAQTDGFVIRDNAAVAYSAKDKGMNPSDKGINPSDKAMEPLDYIERFGPIAALIPVVMGIVCGLIGGILLSTIGRNGVGHTIITILLTIFKVIFVAATGASVGGLVYVIIKRDYTGSLSAWLAPFGAFLAFFSCLGIAFRAKPIAWVCGILAFALALEFIGRIVLLGEGLDTKFSPAEALAGYKSLKTSSNEEANRNFNGNMYNNVPKSVFDGTGGQLIGLTILTAIVCAITCGIAAPWMICKMNRWRTSHTVINGKRLTFTGTGGSLLGHWILWELLTIVTCGIYGFFLHVALRKWELSHTYIEGEPVIAGNTNYFDGNSFAYFGYGILSGLLLICTCGLAYPWVMAMLQKWDTKHQVINGRRLEFTGSGLGFLGEFIIISILTGITCGIYGPWGTVRLNKYIIKNTNFCQ